MLWLYEDTTHFWDGNVQIPQLTNFLNNSLSLHKFFQIC